MQQDINGKPLIFWPNLRPQNLDCPAANAPAAAVANDKQLPQVNLVRLLPVKSVGDNFAVFLKNYAPIFARKEAAHPLLKLRQSHKAVPMTLVLQQLMI